MWNSVNILVLPVAACSLVGLQHHCCTVQVETIGDAYMVSSGIPIQNAEHASELADMALTLCHGVTKFKVYRYNKKLDRC